MPQDARHGVPPRLPAGPRTGFPGCHVHSCVSQWKGALSSPGMPSPWGQLQQQSTQGMMASIWNSSAGPPQLQSANKPPTQTPWSLFLVKPMTDKAPPVWARAGVRAVNSQQTGNSAPLPQVILRPHLEHIATHNQHHALSRGICWCPAGQCQVLGEDRGHHHKHTQHRPVQEHCTQSFMEPGSVPGWAAPGQHFTPLASVSSSVKPQLWSGQSF